LGICYGTDCSQEFPYSIAAGYNGKTPVPDGFRIHEIPARTWAIFLCKGTIPNAVKELYHQIYTEFFPTSDYVPKGEIDIEAYPNGKNDECEVWIAVEKQPR
jgi:AraC family transcriptional regulator